MKAEEVAEAKEVEWRDGCVWRGEGEVDRMTGPLDLRGA